MNLCSEKMLVALYTKRDFCSDCYLCIWVLKLRNKLFYESLGSMTTMCSLLVPLFLIISHFRIFLCQTFLTLTKFIEKMHQHIQYQISFIKFSWNVFRSCIYLKLQMISKNLGQSWICLTLRQPKWTIIWNKGSSCLPEKTLDEDNCVLCTNVSQQTLLTLKSLLVLLCYCSPTVYLEIFLF